MQALAKHKFASGSAQKARLVADQIRGLPVDRALEILAYSPKKAAVLVKKVLESAIANAEHNEGADIDELRVTTIFVDDGPTMKRIMHVLKDAQTASLSVQATSLLWFQIARRYK